MSKPLALASVLALLLAITASPALAATDGDLQRGLVGSWSWSQPTDYGFVTSIGYKF